MMKDKIFLILFLSLLPIGLTAQSPMDSVPPLLTGYNGNEGRIHKLHYFNYVVLKDKSGENERQATGHYWEVNYIYDSVFRQKKSFAEFMTKQITDLDGVLFFADTSQIHFAIPRESQPNLWGKVLLVSDKIYRLHLIEETGFENYVSFDTDVIPAFDAFVEETTMPPRLGYFQNTLITSARYSKFNHFRINYNLNSQSVRQMLMGPYWDMKMQVIQPDGNIDTRISTVHIMESYYRAALKANGKILKSMPRELIFYIPNNEDQKLYVRVLTTLDGLYTIRAVLQNNSDETPPETPQGVFDPEK